jgi:hypothetical protein
MSPAEQIAQQFHETYERLAPDHGYETRKASAVPWANVPERNKNLMVSVVDSLLAHGVIAHMETVELAPDPNAMAGVYRERASLVAYLAACNPSVIVPGADPEASGWPVLYVNTVCGQMSWHISPDDLDLFGHVPIHKDGQPPTWDGHTTEEKYRRLAELVKIESDGP